MGFYFLVRQMGEITKSWQLPHLFLYSCEISKALVSGTWFVRAIASPNPPAVSLAP